MNSMVIFHSYVVYQRVTYKTWRWWNLECPWCSGRTCRKPWLLFECLTDLQSFLNCFSTCNQQRVPFYIWPPDFREKSGSQTQQNRPTSTEIFQVGVGGPTHLGSPSWKTTLPWERSFWDLPPELGWVLDGSHDGNPNLFLSYVYIYIFTLFYVNTIWHILLSSIRPCFCSTSTIFDPKLF